MIITHVNAFFYNSQAAWLNTLTWWGATICFVTFVFSYGIGYGRKLSNGGIDKRKTVKRLAALALGYYLVAGWTYLVWWGNPPQLSGLLRVFLLMDMLAYTEFMLPFVLYGLIVLFLDKFLTKLLEKKWLALVGIVLYILARYLYTLDWGGTTATALKGILVGNGDLNRWGLLSYFVVFAFGLTWGYQFLRSHHRPSFQKAVFIALAALVLLLNFLGFNIERWPPSVLYLAYGLAYSFGVLSLWPILQRLPKLLEPILFMGRHALDFFIGHTLIVITTSTTIGHARFGDAATTLIILAVLSTNYFLAVLLHKFSPSR